MTVAVLALRDAPPAEEGARALLEALAGQPGFVRGEVGRGVEAPHDWVVITSWQRLGDYRRALGSTPAKLATGPLHPLLIEVAAAGGYEVAATA